MHSVLPMQPGAGRLPGDSTSGMFWGPALAALIVLVWSTTLVVDFRVALTLLMVVGFGAAAIGLRYPRLGLLGIAMLCALNAFAAPMLLRGGVWRWNSVNYWLLLVALLFWRSLLRVRQPQSRVLLAFILLLGLEILLSPDPQDGIQQVFAVVTVFGLQIYFRRVGHDPEVWYWLGIVTGVLAASGIAAFLLQEDRIPAVNHNVWSYLPLTAVFASSLAFVVTGHAPRRRFVLALLATLNTVWVFLSGSRGSTLVAAVCLAFLLSMMRLRRALWLGTVAALVSIVVLSQFTTLQEKAAARLRLFTDPSQSLRVRTSGRSEFALGAWYMFQDHPLGVGTGGFRVNWADYLADPRAPEGLSRWKLQHSTYAAHSAWLKVLAENGFPGILLLGAYVLSFSVSAWRTRNPDLLRLGSMVTAALAVAWLSTEFQNQGLWLLAAGATVLLDRDSRWGTPRLANAIARG